MPVQSNRDHVLFESVLKFGVSLEVGFAQREITLIEGSALAGFGGASGRKCVQTFYVIYPEKVH